MGNDGDNNQNNNGGGKNKGGGGNQAKEGLTLSGNINAAAMGSSWPSIKKMLADQTLNASGLIIAGLGIFALKKVVYGLFKIDETAAAPRQINAYDGVGAIYQMQKDNPEKFEQFKAKHAALFGGGQTIDVTPKPAAPAPAADANGGGKQKSK